MNFQPQQQHTASSRLLCCCSCLVIKSHFAQAKETWCSCLKYTLLLLRSFTSCEFQPLFCEHVSSLTGGSFGALQWGDEWHWGVNASILGAVCVALRSKIQLTQFSLYPDQPKHIWSLTFASFFVKLQFYCGQHTNYWPKSSPTLNCVDLLNNIRLCGFNCMTYFYP